VSDSFRQFVEDRAEIDRAYITGHVAELRCDLLARAREEMGIDDEAGRKSEEMDGSHT
jgi:hypothetical protein